MNDVVSSKKNALKNQRIGKVTQVNLKGFSLIEILVTIVLIGVGMIATLSTHSSSMKSNAMADNLTTSIFLAETQMETLASVQNQKLKDLTGIFNADGEKLDRFGQHSDTGTFTRVTTVEYDVPISNAILVTVAVNWRDGFGRHKVEYVTALF